jgi:uncharacterized membrane protein
MSDESTSNTSTSEGLSDNAAGAIAYLTIIPAILFLVMAPYNTKPFVKFHSWQNIGLCVASFCLYIVLFIFMMVLAFIPVLRFLVLLVYPLFGLALLVVWGLCVLKASQGSALKLPLISGFAAKQSGYNG